MMKIAVVHPLLWHRGVCVRVCVHLWIAWLMWHRHRHGGEMGQGDLGLLHCGFGGVQGTCGDR